MCVQIILYLVKFQNELKNADAKMSAKWILLNFLAKLFSKFVTT